MAEIFLSYAEEDRATAGRIAKLFEAHGWSVWWDRRIPAGKTWRAVIEEAIQDMRCMVVLWSRHSIVSEWVLQEAEEGRARGKLLPILIERVIPPLGLRGIQAADLIGWNGAADDPSVTQLIADLRAALAAQRPAPAPIPAPAPTEDEPQVATGPAREVAALRSRMLIASPEELRHLRVEADALAARFPADAEVHRLHDEIRLALESRHRTGPIAAATPARRWFLRPAVAGLAVGVVALLLLVLPRSVDNPQPLSTPADSLPQTTKLEPAARKDPPAAEPVELAAPATADKPAASPAEGKPAPAVEDKLADKPKPDVAAAKPVIRRNAQNPRCTAINERSSVGQPLSAEDRRFLQKEC